MFNLNTNVSKKVEFSDDKKISYKDMVKIEEKRKNLNKKKAKKAKDK